MEKLTRSNLCPGPGDRPSDGVWYCDGDYCPYYCDQANCRPAVEARGYTLTYTEKHYARQRQVAEAAAKTAKKAGSSEPTR